MSDVKCPYCGEEQEINHDYGYGYEEDVVFNQQCDDCDKTFVYTTYVSFSHNAEKADCLNGSDHNWKPQITFPKQFTKMVCTMCDETRKPTDSEMEEILTPNK
ncbi:hypothetical protein HZP54_17610 [Elizabethkingia anophelis]|nr:hypothetical protein [Elizabethkingia anophelis]MCT4256760.1 hypothetical protein [Elizabethkingia anophelis]